MCSGIEAPGLAWVPLGWSPAWFSEIDPFACAVLAHHYPDVTNLGDMRGIARGGNRPAPIDLLVGGTPCQSFSVAGLRKGLADPRGNLALEFLRVLDATRPRWVVWENVPGVLSSNEGRDFGSFLGGMAELGYGWAYRVLDAQFFGVPQRRRRVFLVGHSGDWRPAVAVLFERDSLSGNPPPCRQTGQGVAASLKGRSGNNGSPERGDLNDVQITHSLRGVEFDSSEDGTGRGTPLVPVDVAATLKANTGRNHIESTYIAFDWQKGDGGADDSFRGKSRSWITRAGDYTGALGATKRDAISTPSAVRRLTPVECERLMGMPDGYTAITYRGRPAADGPRYRALGNSMAGAVVRWIGQRIEMVEATRAENAA